MGTFLNNSFFPHIIIVSIDSTVKNESLRNDLMHSLGNVRIVP